MTTTSNDSDPRSRNAVIMGCGRLGASIAMHLSNEGWYVHILDTNQDTFDRLSPDLIHRGQIVPIIGDGMSERALRAARTQDADVFIAVSGRDTRNALAAQVAQHVFEVPKVIWRMNDPTRREMYENLGLVTVSPTRVVADMVVDATRER